MKWLLTGPHMSFDVESTGVSVETDRIVTASTVFISGPRVTKPDTFTCLIDPGIDIPAEATAVHGISTAKARKEGRPPVEALADVAAKLTWALNNNVPVVGANLAYDYTILDRDLRRNGLPPLTDGNPLLAPSVDVQVIDRHLDTYRKGSRRLYVDGELDLCDVYGVRMDAAHNSVFDALAAGRIAWRMAQMTQWSFEKLVEHFAKAAHRYGNRHRPADIADRFLALALSTPDQLHTAQVGWKAGQARGLRAYFEKQGKPVSDIHEAWPMVSFKEEQ